MGAWILMGLWLPNCGQGPMWPLIWLRGLGLGLDVSLSLEVGGEAV